jgi:ubiquinone/menaquinone biosynthesis C-methylase UbiE
MRGPTLTEDRVKAVNEIYHDIESEVYRNRHPEIYREEMLKWEDLGRKYFVRPHPITVLDIGTGVGFVPAIIAKYLKPEDLLICSDISEKMLEVARDNLSHYGGVGKQFIKADALEVARHCSEVDIITMNSVLHHLPDYEKVLLSLGKALRPNGYFMIMHERNRRFGSNPSLALKGYAMLRLLAGKAYHFVGRLVKQGQRLAGLNHEDRTREDFCERVQRAILDRKVCDNRLSIEEINAIVDIHDPDEGGEGFDPYVLQQEYFRDYRIVEMFFDKFLGPWVDTRRNALNRYLSSVIEKTHPDAGAIFGMILQRNPEGR